MTPKIKAILFAGGAFVTLFIVIVIVLKVKKKLAKYDLPDDDRPLKPEDIFDENTGANAVTADEMKKAQKYARLLKNDMEGPNFFGHQDELYKTILEFSDRELSILNAVFNKEYGDGETLFQWIDNDLFFNWEVTETLKKRLAGV